MKLLQICVILLLTSFTSVFSQNTYNKTVDFSINQDGVSLSGSATVAAEFVFFGYPYLKVKYSDLEISTLNYKNEYFSSTSNRDILAFPFKPANGGYYVNAEMIVTIAYVDTRGELAINTNLVSNTFDDNVKAFTIKDKIYTVADTYSEQPIDNYFRELDHQKYSDSDFWENSALLDATINGLSPNIIRQMTTIIDAKLREKEQEKEKKSENDDDDFDDFLSGKNKSSSQKESSGDDFDDFLSGKKAEKNSSNTSKEKDDFDAFLSGEITDVDRSNYRIDSKNGTSGVVTEGGKVLIPYRDWDIESYDPISQTAKISINYESIYEKSGYCSQEYGGEAEIRVSGYIQTFDYVNFTGQTIMPSRKEAYLKMDLYIFSWSLEEVPNGRNLTANERAAWGEKITSMHIENCRATYYSLKKKYIKLVKTNNGTYHFNGERYYEE